MSKVKDIFNKPVDRPIEGVIKADDEASLRLEVEEYVLTNEVEKRLEQFLDAYNNYEGANGVWVSGYFGSGKSHLLKMLALMLENRSIDGASIVDLFLPKCGENEILQGDIKRAVAIPSKSILFNIDQKADVISKTEFDALLSVFVKVFDEMCGYYGKQGHIAQFERDLESRSVYESFQSEYETIAGISWQRGREQALFESQNIAKAYAKATGGDEGAAEGILDKYRDQYRVSIEDFAESVDAYIERQSPKFRLNFFVDEVGQYIAENTKLMTNLQTIAESLATKCRGRAWVIVTAQEDMGTVIGEMDKQQSNDFSKIQARFANRVKLTSADVAEVIQKRLLQKNEDGVGLLSDIYHEQHNNFKTLFDFADGSQTYRNYQDREHFIHSYPFIPYQFSLFQAAIQNLSMHNAFEGKHSSVGERSMLGVFQEVAIHIGDYTIGQLATFDLMFEGIRTSLKSNIQRAILQAEKNLDAPFAIRLLKALFLVKYIKEFKPTVRNISVLMLDDFHQNVQQLKERVEEGLARLEQETYIQRNGELYEYLTDEEKDVEQEIKNTDVDTTEVAAELEKLVFDFVIKQRKIRFDENGQDYPFSRKLDDKLHGRDYELAIHVVSPFYEHSENEQTLRMHTMGRDELMVVMPSDDRLVRDLMMYKRTEKYVRQNRSSTQAEGVKRILESKESQNQERHVNLKLLVESLLGQATLFRNGAEIEIASQAAQNKIIKGFHELISCTYPNLRMLRGATYKEDQVTKWLKASEQGLFGNDATAMSEAEQEMAAFIQSNHRGGVRTTIKHVIEKFERKPYGWYYAAILCNLAKLCARGKVEVRSDGNLLDEQDLERALRNTHGHSNVVLEPQVEFTASQVRALKTFYEDFFDAPPRSSEAKALGKETEKAFSELLQQLTPLVAQTAQYPFLHALNPIVARLKTLTGKPYTWYVSELARKEDELLDLKEDVLTPVRTFMAGPLREIYDTARDFVQDEKPNFEYLPGAEVQAVTESLGDVQCYKGNRMQQVKAHVATLRSQIQAQIEQELLRGKELLESLEKKLCGMNEFEALKQEQQEQLVQPFSDCSKAIEQENLIAVIRDTLRRFEDSEYQRLLSQMTAWAAPEQSQKEQQPDTPASEAGNSKAPVQPETKIEYVPSRSIRVSFSKAWLADEQDVELYLESMREALLDEIKKGKRVQI